MSCDNWTAGGPGQQIDSEISPQAIARGVMCPACGELLAVPVGCRNCFVSCGRCRRRFRLPKRIEVVEETIVSWLNEPLSEPAPPERAGAATRATPITSSQDIDTSQCDLKVVRVGSDGVLLEFSASRLKDADFRASMPRRCLGCGIKEGLRAYLVVFMPHLRNNILLEARRLAGKATLDENDAALLDDDELLQSLARVPDVPPPADRPMPYWLCQPCQGVGAVCGRIDTTSGPGGEQCLMLIRNHQLANEFFTSAASKDTTEYKLSAVP